MDFSALIHSTHIAVVGASRDPNKVGHQVVRNLLKNPHLYIYPVNPNATNILNQPTYPTLQDIPHSVDLVIITIPAPLVEPVIDVCIDKKVSAVILMTAGFAEQGKRGELLQHTIVDKLMQAHITLLGPNTMGYINPYTDMYASFGGEHIQKGNIAVISQSGAMISALFQMYESAHVGVSFAVSVGNKGGITELECLEYAEHDPHTHIIALYVESFAHIRACLETVRRISKTKPVFLLKGGVTSEGIQAAVSHTAALATPQTLLIDASHQFGMVYVHTFEQCVRATIAASKVSFLPEHIAVITNAGGPGVVITDELAQVNLHLTPFSLHTQEALTSTLPHLALHNPLDLLGDATAERFDHALTILSQDHTIDTLVILLTQQSVTDMNTITRILTKPRGKKIVYVALIGGEQLDMYRTQLERAGVLVTSYPNEIVETLDALTRARTYMHRPHDHAQYVPKYHHFPQTFEDLTHMLEACHVYMPNQRIISTQNQISTLSQLSYPLIAKTTNLSLKHKAKLGAVVGNICDLSYARIVFDHLQAWNHPVVFQETIREGREALIGCTKDPQFGWYMAIGIGGSMSDAIADRAYCFLPASRDEFSYTLKKTRLFTLLSPIQTIKLLNVLERLQHVVLSTENLTEL